MGSSALPHGALPFLVARNPGSAAYPDDSASAGIWVGCKIGSIRGAASVQKSCALAHDCDRPGINLGPLSLAYACDPRIPTAHEPAGRRCAATAPPDRASRAHVVLF